MALQKFNFYEVSNRLEGLQVAVKDTSSILEHLLKSDKVHKTMLEQIHNNMEAIAQERTFDLMKIDDVCELLKLEKSTIYSMVHKRKIPFIKKGKLLYFDRNKINEWLEQDEFTPNTVIKQN